MILSERWKHFTATKQRAGAAVRPPVDGLGALWNCLRAELLEEHSRHKEVRQLANLAGAFDSGILCADGLDHAAYAWASLYDNGSQVARAQNSAPNTFAFGGANLQWQPGRIYQLELGAYWKFRQGVAARPPVIFPPTRRPIHPADDDTAARFTWVSICAKSD